MAKQQQEEVKEGLPAWMGTYGDMVTLLLCFFVLLFSMSSVDVRKFKEAIASFNEQIDILPGGTALSDGERINNGTDQLANIEILIDKALEQGTPEEGTDEDNREPTEAEIMEAALEKAEEVFQDVGDYLEEQGVEDEVEMKYSLNYVKITLPGETLFDSGQARIKTEGIPVVDALGDMVSDPRFAEYSVQIEGHTDNVPISTAYFPSNWELSAARAIAVGNYIIDEKGFSEDRIACTGYGEYRPITDNDSSESRAENRRVEVKIVFQPVEVDVNEYDEATRPEFPEDENELLEGEGAEGTEAEEATPSDLSDQIMNDIMNGAQPLQTNP